METRPDESTPTQLKTEVLSDLATLRDTVKVRGHLLSLEARRALHAAEARLGVLERNIQRGSERVTAAAMTKAQELSRTLGFLLDGKGEESSDREQQVRWIMQDVVRTTAPEEHLDSAARILWEEDCGIAPVVSPTGKLVGMITDRDICMAVYTQGRPAQDIAVSTAMSHEVHSCAPSDTVFEALATMGKERVRRLPVVDSEGRVLGIVSLSDIARFAHALDDGDISRAVVRTLASITDAGPTN